MTDNTNLHPANDVSSLNSALVLVESSYMFKYYGSQASHWSSHHVKIAEPKFILQNTLKQIYMHANDNAANIWLLNTLFHRDKMQ